MVRMHRKDQSFALPFEARQRIAIDNAEDEAIRTGMLAQLRLRARAVLGDGASEDFVELAAEVTVRTLQLGFEREGLEFAHFVSR